jgi:hypothetical protein
VLQLRFPEPVEVDANIVDVGEAERVCERSGELVRTTLSSTAWCRQATKIALTKSYISSHGSVKLQVGRQAGH